MSDLDSIVSVSITASGAPLSRDDFGTPLLVRGVGTTTSVKTYTKDSWATAIVADGYTTGDPVYRAASAIFGQTPCVSSFKVLIVGAKVVQAGSATVAAFSTGTVNSATVYRMDGTTVTYTRTAPGASSANAEAAALAALIQAGETNLTVTAVATPTISWTTNNAAGDVVHITWSSNMTAITQTTADPGYTTALTAALGLDNGWYGILLDTHSSALIAAVDAWAQSNGKLFVPATSNSLEITQSTGNIGAAIKAAAYTRTGLIWHAYGQEYIAAALMSRMFATKVGAGTWALKTLAGVTADTLTPTQITNLETNYTTYYVSRASRNVTQGGKRGDGDYLDTTRGTDAVTNDIQIRVATALMNNDKLPYDDDGLNVIGNEVLASLNSFTAKGNRFLLPDQNVVNVPLASSISSTDRASRTVNSITFSAKFASAIHKATLTGTLGY